MPFRVGVVVSIILVIAAIGATQALWGIGNRMAANAVAGAIVGGLGMLSAEIAYNIGRRRV